MTLQGALRFDRAWSYSPEQTIGPNATSWPRSCRSRRRPASTLQGPLAARRSGLRRLRQRQDVAQGQLRQVPRAGEQPERQLLDLQSDRPHCDDGVADVDRQRHWRAGHAGFGDFIPQCDLHQQSRPTANAAAMTPTTFGTATRRPRRSIPRSSTAGACGRATGRSASRCSSSCCRAISVEVGYFRRWLQNFTATDNTALDAGRLHTVQHHRAGRSAAARRRRLRRSTVCYNVIAAGFAGRPATTSRSPTTSAGSTRATTACWSTSAREPPTG